MTNPSSSHAALPVGLSARDALHRVAERMRDWRFFCWYWGDAIAVDSLLDAHDLIGGPYRDAAIESLVRWNTHCRPNFDDVLAPGGSIVRLVMEGHLPPAAGERVLAALAGLPPVAGEIPALEPHRLAFRYGLCIDAVYHLPRLYALAARWRGEAALARKAVRIAVDSMRLLACTHGWAQWYDPTHRRNNDVAWSRGLGWAVLGLLDLVQAMEGQGAQEAADLAAQVLECLARSQQADGHWGAVLGHPAAGAETSTATFYVAAALHPAARGLVSLPQAVLERAVQAMVAATSIDGTYTGVSADVLPSWDLKTYEQPATEISPWAQGAAVRAYAALARSA